MSLVNQVETFTRESGLSSITIVGQSLFTVQRYESCELVYFVLHCFKHIHCMWHTRQISGMVSNTWQISGMVSNTWQISCMVSNT